MPKKILLALCICMILVGGCAKKEESPKAEQLVNVVEARNLGLAYLEENRLDEAEQEFLKVITHAPEDPMGYANLGIVYMRKGEYTSAEERVQRAVDMVPEDPDITLILAEVHEAAGENEKAEEILLRSLRKSPDHVRSLYRISEIYVKMGYLAPDDSSIQIKREKRLVHLVDIEPASMPARLQLIESLLTHQLTDSALAHMELLVQQIPEPPKETVNPIRDALKAMQAGNNPKASRSFRIVHNVLKVTARYQADLIELKGPGGANIGFPILNFSENLSQRLEDESTVLKTLRFTDATELSGLDFVNGVVPNGAVSLMAVADFDGDNSQDIYCSVWDGDKNHVFLFHQEFGEFIDVASESGLRHGGIDLDARFADIDNDGHLDLIVANTAGVRYYQYDGKNQFEDISSTLAMDKETEAKGLLTGDFDHDGDLDIYVLQNGANLFWRNNLDGSFSETAGKMNIDGGNGKSRDAIFGDIDDDGDLDIVVLDEIRPLQLYSNLRQGQFEKLDNVAFKRGGSILAAADYNNDGWLDLLILGKDGTELYRNKGEGLFERAVTPFSAPAEDGRFFDFDNDGWLDLVIAGKEKTTLYHNKDGEFEDVSHVLPEGAKSGLLLDIIDYNQDGDLDILMISEDRKIRLYRNDGGNMNKYLNVRLVGLRTGSGKNNHFGLGARVEIRAGDLYQSRVVTSEVTHFGIGQRLKADVIRIIWNNGVPQNLFFPGSDQDIVEEQILKGSCPFLYAWNGERYEFVKDILWRSALGMPLGIMAGEMAYAFANSTEEYVKIPGEALIAKDGKYKLQLTMELWETNYYDDVKLHVVDHPAATEVYIDEKFAIPPYPPNTIYTVSEKRLPLSAIDGEGNDLLPMLREWDYEYVSNFILTDFQGIAEPHDLILDLGDLKKSDDIVLFLHGWLFPSDASINVNRSQSSEGPAFPPRVQVPDKNGEWKTVIGSINFPNGKDKTCVVDLSGKFLTDDFRVRLQTSMQIYWDHIFFTVNEPDVEVVETVLSAASADLHYRGFSRMYRKGGRYGPHWFDYSTVTAGPKWRDLTGMYTRYGDVTPLLESPDNLSVIMNSGDELTVTFSQTDAPPLRDGWKRDYLLYSDGWLKDGDLNTATGNIVGPLPFQGITAYPYGPEQKIPKDEEFHTYLKQYNTREVKGDLFRRVLSQEGDK